MEQLMYAGVAMGVEAGVCTKCKPETERNMRKKSNG